MIPSASDLSYFSEIASTLNVSRAAERLGISQPSLSLAVQRLEQAVGVPLLIRSKRGVSLTQGGKQLLAHTRHLLETWDHVQAKTLASMNAVEGSYTIGCHPSVGLYLLSAFLPQIVEKYPSININLRHDLSRRIAEDVVSLKIDIGVVVNPVQHPDLVIHKLCTDEVTFWTAKHKKQSVCDIYSGKAILICDPDLAQSQSLMKKMKKKNMVFERIMSSSSLEVIADLTANGCGIGILPSKVAARFAKNLKPIEGAPVFTDDHCLIHRVETKRIKAIEVLKSAIIESIQ